MTVGHNIPEGKTVTPGGSPQTLSLTGTLTLDEIHREIRILFIRGISSVHPEICLPSEVAAHREWGEAERYGGESGDVWGETGRSGEMWGGQRKEGGAMDVTAIEAIKPDSEAILHLCCAFSHDDNDTELGWEQKISFIGTIALAQLQPARSIHLVYGS